MKTVFDLTRILSAFDIYDSVNDHNFIYDLSKLLEGIVLYDQIVITDNYDRFIKEFIESDRSLNVDKNILEKLFDQIIHSVEHETVIGEISKAIFNPLNDSKLFPKTGDYYLVKDIAYSNQLLNNVDFNNLQFWNPENSTENVKLFTLLNQITRTRVLALLADKLNAVYDPISFRSNILKNIPSLYKGNDENIAKLFEKELYKYINTLGIKDHLSLDLPLFSNFVIKQAGWKNINDLFHIAFQLRDEKDIVQLRKLMDAHKLSIEQLKIKKLAKIEGEIQNQIRLLKKKLSGTKNSLFSIGINHLLIPGVSFNPAEMYNYFKRYNIGKSLSVLSKYSLKTYGTMIDPEKKIESFIDRELIL